MAEPPKKRITFEPEDRDLIYDTTKIHFKVLENKKTGGPSSSKRQKAEEIKEVCKTVLNTFFV